MTDAMYRDAPEPYAGVASLMRQMASGAQFAQLVNDAAANPDPANMLMGLSAAMLAVGQRDMGLELQAKALAIRPRYRLSGGAPGGLRLLALMRPGGMRDNTPLDFLLEDSAVTLDLLYIRPEAPFPPDLPAHDVLFVAVAHADESQSLLGRLSRLAGLARQPVLNQPERIRRLAREGLCTMLGAVPGVHMPVTARVGRGLLQEIGRGEVPLAEVLEGGGFPIIVRPVDSHGGEGLARLDHPESIADYLDPLPGAEFHIARFVDYRSPDGLYRKCRVALIDGRPYACHLAVSEHWMVHYNRAGMTEHGDRRAEEADFLARFDEDFGRRHGAAFAAIAERIGLDYVVLDCGQTREGELLVFEADNAGFVHAMDPADIFPYKAPHMRKVFDAFVRLLDRAASSGGRP